MRFILGLFGLKVIYIDDRGEFNYRYDGLDQTAGRPIHPDMSVAHPFAKRSIRKIK